MPPVHCTLAYATVYTHTLSLNVRGISSADSRAYTCTRGGQVQTALLHIRFSKTKRQDKCHGLYIKYFTEI